jgi:nucleoside-diphosphate-sugar epimerase
VGDVVNAMNALIQHPQAYGEVFNIGHTKEISIMSWRRWSRG